LRPDVSVYHEQNSVFREFSMKRNDVFLNLSYLPNVEQSSAVNFYSEGILT